jgi:hypothetical protein
MAGLAPSPTRPARPGHRRAPAPLAWIAFSGQADHAWLRLLRPGFRHCFAALRDEAGWTVLDPLTGRILVARLDVPANFDVPGFYRRAGLAVLGPFAPDGPAPAAMPRLMPMTCVSICRAVLGPGAPRAWTPHGLYRALQDRANPRKKNLTMLRRCG